MIKATQLYPPRDPDQVSFEAPGGIDFVRIDSESLELANDSCMSTFEEAFISGTAPTTYCTLHGLKISETIEKVVTEPTKEVAKGIGKVIRGVGGIFGGIFGGGDKQRK